MASNNHRILKTCLIMMTLSNQVRSESITCTNPTGCNWVCSGNNNCDHNIYFCPSTSAYCHLTCTSCSMLQIFSSSDTFDIICMDGKGCSNLQTTAQTPTSKINIQCGSSSRCTAISMYCPANNLQNCKCSDTAPNVCEAEVSITPIIQQTTPQYPTSFLTTPPSQHPTAFPTTTSTSSLVSVHSTQPTEPALSTMHAVHDEAVQVISTTQYLEVFAEEYVLNNEYMILMSGTAVLMLCIGIAFIYYSCKQTKSKSTKNIFGFELSELENDNQRTQNKQKISESSYIMTVMDTMVTEAAEAVHTHTRDASEGVLVLNEMKSTDGIAMTHDDGMVTVEESLSNDTHDAMYGPGTGGQFHPTLGVMETVDLGRNERCVAFVHSDSE
eukprot:224099_1